MQGGANMSKPKDVAELCDRLRPYFGELTEWLQRLSDQVEELKPGKGSEGGDPPPPPPELD
jgi:hypothetical protein